MSEGVRVRGWRGEGWEEGLFSVLDSEGILRREMIDGGKECDKELDMLACCLDSLLL